MKKKIIYIYDQLTPTQKLNNVSKNNENRMNLFALTLPCNLKTHQTTWLILVSIHMFLRYINRVIDTHHTPFLITNQFTNWSVSVSMKIQESTFKPTYSLTKFKKKATFRTIKSF